MALAFWIGLLVLITALVLLVIGIVWYETNQRNNVPISFWSYALLISSVFLAFLALILMGYYYSS